MTGFRVKSNISGAFKAIGGVRASQFEPDVKTFLKRSLTTAITMTPARNLNTIRAAQKKQYDHRVNYIPSYHTLEDPTLIVKDDDTQWLYRGGKWYRPDIWQLPDDVWNDYEMLSHERDRRMQTSESEFIEARGQARFLFRKSWWEIGASAGLSIACPAEVRNGTTRRRKPPLNPPRGYAQVRGGKDAYSIVVRNPFLDQTSAGGHTPLSTETYKPFTGQEIIGRAMDQHRQAFEKDVAKKTERLIIEILKRFL